MQTVMLNAGIYRMDSPFVRGAGIMSDDDKQILTKFLKFCERNYTPEEQLRLMALIVRVVRGVGR